MTGYSPERTLDETILVRRASQGDLTAWEALMAAQQESIFRLAYLLLGDPDEAEDVAQETFLRAWTSLSHFDSARPLRPWLLRIAANLSRNRRRSAGRYLSAVVRAFRAEPAASTVEETSTERQDAQQLWAAVRRLATPDQQIIFLRYFLDIPVAESAQVMQVAEGTIKSRLSRALNRLREVVEREYPHLGGNGP